LGRVEDFPALGFAFAPERLGLFFGLGNDYCALAVGIAFDAPDPSKTGGQLLPAMVENLKLTYPVGYANREAVDSYLGRTGKEILAIPQIVVIDRNGMIRAVTGDHTDPSLEDENSLRTLVDGLLKERPPAETRKSRQ